MARRVLNVMLAAAALALVASACGGSGPPAKATIAIHYSRFEPAELTVRAGQPVTLTLENDDPIEHEWIVGPPDVHERHRTGTEPYHDQISTEVTIPALETRVTTVTFAPGQYLFVCHLPGHEAYGMVGALHAVES